MYLNSGRLYSLYRDVVVEIVYKERTKILIQTGPNQFKWVTEKDLTPWEIPGMKELIDDTSGKRRRRERVKL